jgi:hypothetical protein
MQLTGGRNGDLDYAEGEGKPFKFNVVAELDHRTGL